MKHDIYSVAVYQFEATNVCNLACSFCPKESRWADRQEGFMDLSLIERVDWSHTKYVELQMTGESTLHPKLAEIATALRNKGLLVGLSSNGTRRFDFSVFDSVTTTKDTEREFKIEGPNVDFQVLGDTHPYEDYTHTKPAGQALHLSCVTPFTHISIQWDGDVVPCCKCHGKQHVFGNLYDQTFAEIIRSSRRMDFLERMAATGRDANYICKFCTAPNPHKIHTRLVEKIEARGKGK